MLVALLGCGLRFSDIRSRDIRHVGSFHGPMGLWLGSCRVKMGYGGISRHSLMLGI